MKTIIPNFYDLLQFVTRKGRPELPPGCTNITDAINVINTLVSHEPGGPSEDVDVGSIYIRVLEKYDSSFGDLSNSARAIEISGFETVVPTMTFYPNIETFAIKSNPSIVSTSAFQSMARLKCFNLPDSVITIGDNAFSEAYQALAGDTGAIFKNSYKFPKKLQHIGDSAFYVVTFEGEVNLLDTELVDIANFAFSTNSEVAGTITTLTLPATLTAIGDYCFFNQRIGTLDLKSVQTVGEWAFASNVTLTSITCPNATTFGSNAFDGCTALKTVQLGSKGNPCTNTNLPITLFNGCDGVAITIYTTNGEALTNAPFGATNSTVTYVDATITQ